MPDAYIVEYCSPTLAGLKTESMFTAKADPKTIRSEILKINRRITQYGLRLVPLRFRNGNVLLYPRAKRTPSICSLIKTYGW